MATTRRHLAVGLSVVGWVTVLSVALHLAVPIRTVFVVAFVGLGPGVAALRFVATDHWVESAVVAVGLSLATGAIVTEVLALAHLETAMGGLIVLAAMTSLAALWPRRHAAPEAAAAGDVPMTGVR